MNIKAYLEKIQADESIFPMDSFAGADDGPYDDDEYPDRNRKPKKVVGTVHERKAHLRRAMIDLDRTIHKYSKSWQDGSIYDPPFEGAREAINWLKSLGFEIVIFTTRASRENAIETGDDVGRQVAMVEAWLKKYYIPYDRITGEKLAALFYIDDRAIHIPNGDWDHVKSIIEKRLSSLASY
jgi:hypothetical protein